MNQGDLADAVAAAAGAEKAEAARVVGALLDAIRGFGGFEAARRSPRKGRNPRTGEAVEVAPMTLVRFRPGEPLEDALNGGGAPAARSSR